MRTGHQMLAALRFVAAHPGCAKIDVALALHPGSSRILPQSFGAGYATINRCIAAGWVSAGFVAQSRAPIYSLVLTTEGLAFLKTKAPSK